VLLKTAENMSVLGDLAGDPFDGYEIFGRVVDRQATVFDLDRAPILVQAAHHNGASEFPVTDVVVDERSIVRMCDGNGKVRVSVEFTRGMARNLEDHRADVFDTRCRRQSEAVDDVAGMLNEQAKTLFAFPQFLLAPAPFVDFAFQRDEAAAQYLGFTDLVVYSQGTWLRPVAKRA